MWRQKKIRFTLFSVNFSFLFLVHVCRKKKWKNCKKSEDEFLHIFFVFYCLLWADLHKFFTIILSKWKRRMRILKIYESSSLIWVPFWLVVQTSAWFIHKLAYFLTQDLNWLHKRLRSLRNGEGVSWSRSGISPFFERIFCRC